MLISCLCIHLSIY